MKTEPTDSLNLSGNAVVPTSEEDGDLRGTLGGFRSKHTFGSF
jgi:hypothetical protein